MGRRGISYEKKLEAVEKYKRGEGSQDSIAWEYGVDRSSLRQWIANYEAMGSSRLAVVHTNNRYSVELKTVAADTSIYFWFLQPIQNLSTGHITILC
mgnify:FL=1